MIPYCAYVTNPTSIRTLYFNNLKIHISFYLNLRTSFCKLLQKILLVFNATHNNRLFMLCSLHIEFKGKRMRLEG